MWVNHNIFTLHRHWRVSAAFGDDPKSLDPILTILLHGLMNGSGASWQPVELKPVRIKATGDLPNCYKAISIVYYNQFSQCNYISTCVVIIVLYLEECPSDHLSSLT